MRVVDVQFEQKLESHYLQNHPELNFEQLIHYLFYLLQTVKCLLKQLLVTGLSLEQGLHN